MIQARQNAREVLEHLNRNLELHIEHLQSCHPDETIHSALLHEIQMTVDAMNSTICLKEHIRDHDGSSW